ncbi:hypothetical protein LTR10_014701 [Elasticomyces elasticus]|uniref:N-acetyltransferase domain-containing protein n=1 Tax=Exophiala sideris TaxID=1016849 RepID=A0ABR0J6U5_9EURO|nr:hypothetical protein LTR10_014701 [Elasticomyces elasticus]KAK5029346.1 hypothetical protein LTS07_005808 [Exophiala sideris]KAK5036958.1 hypothetical protein LTR13_005338 [Exophiala sideris]KAK5057976.1 hypothetical protein LTR69_006973 [Exophiala sideris]KAK5181935.1 hypothetical protein LTR44_005536 [Eurotiomycetes sp. CCFEE 6388]
MALEFAGTLKLHELSPSNPADHSLIPAIARIHLVASLPNELDDAVQDPSLSHGQIIAASRLKHLEILKSDASSHYAVVLDVGVGGDDRTGHDEQRHPAPDQVIAWVKYDIIQSQKAEEERQDTGEIKYHPYTNRPPIHPVPELILASRQRIGKSLGAYVSVDQMAEEPSHGGRGAGRMLMEHIMKKADELGLPATLDATPQNMNLYTSMGFHVVNELWVDMIRFDGGRDKGEAWSKDHHRTPGQGAGWYRQFAMIRQPQKASFGVCSRDEVAEDHTGGGNKLGNPDSPWSWLDMNYE